jgi:hypothetical protein
MITDYEKENTILTNRFLTTNKQKAFELKNTLEAMGGKHWLVGLRIKDRIAIDIDSHNTDNLKKVWKFYVNLYSNPFKIIKTGRGFHLIQEHKEANEGLQFARCRLLFPFMSFNLTEEITQDVINFFHELKKEREGKDYTLQELKALALLIPKKATERGLNYSVGNIDVLHALLAIQKEYYVIRVSKKTKDETMGYYNIP